MHRETAMAVANEGAAERGTIYLAYLAIRERELSSGVNGDK